jgi:dCTP deaminase
VIDPKDFAPTSFVDRKTDTTIIPPNSFRTWPHGRVFPHPRDVLVICLGKSTYARCGIIVNVTLLERNGKAGHYRDLNTTPLPARIHAHEASANSSSCRATRPARPATPTSWQVHHQRGVPS